MNAAPSLRILVLEDDAGDAKLVERALAKGGFAFSVRHAAGRTEFEAALDVAKPDVILADYKLPDFDGLRALEISRGCYPDVPVIIVTGKLSDEVAVDLLAKGAADYVLKDRLSRLAPAVCRALERARVEAERLELEKRYRTLFMEARDGMVLIQHDSGKIIDCNLEFERQCGRPLAELRKLSIAELCPTNTVEETHARFRTIREPDTGGDVYLGLRHPDGTEVDIEVRSKAITVAGKQYIQSVCRDITRRLRDERELKEQLDELRRFQRATVGRELRMKEFREENARLKEQLARRGTSS